MNGFSLKQSSGNYATVVDVIVKDTADGTFYSNVVTVLTDHEPTVEEVELEAFDTMTEQVEREGTWARVLGAAIRPFGAAGFIAEANA